MSDDYAILGEQITPPTPTGGGVPASFDTGTVTQVIDATHIKVNLGDKEVTVIVPATLAGTAPVDASVRVSTQENSYVLDSVIQGAGAGTLPVGAITMWLTTTPPAGWLTLDGGTYSAAAYPALFAVLGTTTLPNMADRGPVGRSGTKTVGSTGGSATVTLSTAQLPGHTHDMGNHTHTMGNHTHAHLHDHGMSHTHNMSHVHNTPGQSGIDDNNFTNTASFQFADQAGSGGVTNTSQPSTTNTGGSSTSATASNTADPNTDGPSTNTTAGPSNNTTGSTGSGTAVTTQDPYVALNFIIKAA